ncbi:MFS transporter [Actinoplanes sp. M2I2]|uniref:MFS transporter n=1 Tax=Actinoplanes sp. M2I2 TaxID=1734444 RepID=UPI0020221E21|nr:MFS transporter [Actinoplanes sp. M2I2]
MDLRAWSVLLVLCGAIFLEGIDIAMLNVALPAIRADLGLSTGLLSGVVSAYVLGYGGFMLLGGRAADLLGRRRMFLFWLAVFLIFSGLGGLATEGWQLLVARFITGVAAAFMTPAGLALITANFPDGPLRNRALGVYAGTAAGGFSLGLVAGGALVTIGWRWVFFAPVLLAAVLLAAAVPLLRDTAPPPRPARAFDLRGAVTVTTAMLLLAYAVVDLAVGPALAGLALLAVFVAIERRAPHPLVRLGILRSARLIRVNVTAHLFLFAFAGFQFVVTLYLQELRGWSPMRTGLVMLLAGIDTVLAPTLTTWLVNRHGAVRVLFGGLVAGVLAYASFLPVTEDWTYSAMVPGLVLLGVAFALAYGPLTMAATEGVAEREHGLAGGLLYTAIQFGTALGISAVTAVSLAGGVSIGSIRAALWLPVGAVVVAAAVTAFGLAGERRPKPAVVLT